MTRGFSSPSRQPVAAPYIELQTELEISVKAGLYIYPALGGDFPGNFALNATQAAAQDVRGIMAPFSGHWIPEEQPYFVVEQLTQRSLAKDSKNSLDRSRTMSLNRTVSSIAPYCCKNEPTS